MTPVHLDHAKPAGWFGLRLFLQLCSLLCLLVGAYVGGRGRARERFQHSKECRLVQDVTFTLCDVIHSNVDLMLEDLNVGFRC